MKLSVSTLGCPDWSLDDILTRCARYGYDAVELRGIGGDLDLTQTPEFSGRAALTATRRRFEDAGLAIAAIDSSAKFSDPSMAEENMEIARAAIDMAAVLGAPFVRVFGGAVEDGADRRAAVRQVGGCLRRLGDYAENRGDIVIVLETHDSFSTGAQVAEALQAAHRHPRVAALWDLHHPFRHGETPTRTAEMLEGAICLVHVKDSRPGETYCLLGDGDIPILPCLRELAGRGYGGYVSVEWEKRWIPDLLPPEVAFPQYAAKLREYFAELG